MDGTLVPTDAECKAGIDIAYNGVWGYHPLVVSLANTGEVLSVLNRPGNRPSHEGAAAEVDRALKVCLEGGFRKVLLRGDTDFSQTKHLDRWSADARVQFIFGLDQTAARHVLADDLQAAAWQSFASWGGGVYKSTNGGATFQHMGLADSKHINRIVIDPNNNDVVLVAATGPLFGSGGDRGIYKTTDGGRTWKQVL